MSVHVFNFGTKSVNDLTDDTDRLNGTYSMTEMPNHSNDNNNDQEYRLCSQLTLQRSAYRKQKMRQKYANDRNTECVGASPCNIDDVGRDASGTERKYLMSVSDDELPHLDNNENILHVFARNNFAKQIKIEADEFDKEYIEMCFQANCQGNIPAMEAANRCQKAALLALVVPFLVSPDKLLINRLIHHRNNRGECLLTWVSRFAEPLSAVHGILIEMELILHDYKPIEVKKCLRLSLGSTDEARRSVEIVDVVASRYSRRSLMTMGSRLRCWDNFNIFVRNFLLLFALKSIVMLADMGSDIYLLRDYYNLWDKQSQLSSNATLPSHCLESSKFQLPPTVSTSQPNDGSDLSSSDITFRIFSIDLSCYEGAISGMSRFLVTLLFVTLPYILYLFEMVRFGGSCCSRQPLLVSASDVCVVKDQETVCKRHTAFTGQLSQSPVWQICQCLMRIPLAVAEFILWPFLNFFRQFWHAFRLDIASDKDQIVDMMTASDQSSYMASRAQLIEVCTESSLQPIFQFYLVFQDILQIDLASYISGLAGGVGERIFPSLLFSVEEKKRQTISVTISIVAIAWSYTMQYNTRKDNVLSITACAVYFVYVVLMVVARLLAFEMFAYGLGVGQFASAIAALVGHIAVAAFLHFIFSDAINQLDEIETGQSGKSAMNRLRQVAMVVQNCIFNGLANIYVHNDLDRLDIGLDYQDHSRTEWTDKHSLDGTNSLMSRENSVNSRASAKAEFTMRRNRRKSRTACQNGCDGQKCGVRVPGPFKVRRTLYRQLAFEVVFALEIGLMLFAASYTKEFMSTKVANNSDADQAEYTLYWVLTWTVVTCYVLANLVRILFYTMCHPWADLIRERRCRTTDQCQRPTSSTSTSSSSDETYTCPANNNYLLLGRDVEEC